MTYIRAIKKYGELMKVKRKDIISQYGCKESHIYYIQEGFVRKYNYDDEGSEITFDFAGKGDFVNSYDSFLNNTFSQIVVEAVTDGKLYKLSKNAFDTTIESDIEISKKIRSIFSKNLENKIRFSRLDKRQQFKMLMAYDSKLLLKVQKQHIASYIGVTPQTISKWIRIYNNI